MGAKIKMTELRTAMDTIMRRETALYDELKTSTNTQIRETAIECKTRASFAHDVLEALRGNKVYLNIRLT